MISNEKTMKMVIRKNWKLSFEDKQSQNYLSSLLTLVTIIATRHHGTSDLRLVQLAPCRYLLALAPNSQSRSPDLHYNAAQRKGSGIPRIWFTLSARSLLTFFRALSHRIKVG